jgi:hypothetical protein
MASMAGASKAVLITGRSSVRRMDCICDRRLEDIADPEQHGCSGDPHQRRCLERFILFARPSRNEKRAEVLRACKEVFTPLCKLL